jgi:hypothetical protein
MAALPPKGYPCTLDRHADSRMPSYRLDSDFRPRSRTDTCQSEKWQHGYQRRENKEK